MTSRWWGRALGPAIATILLAVSAGAGAGVGEAHRARWELVGRAEDGVVVLRARLPDGRFTLEYRNSLYGSPAAEHFAVTDDGRLALVGLAATDAAILHEYYGTTLARERVQTGAWAGWWLAPAPEPLELAALTVAASPHGERTLVAGNEIRIPLWRAAGDAGPQITLEARPAR